MRRRNIFVGVLFDEDSGLLSEGHEFRAQGIRSHFSGSGADNEDNPGAGHDPGLAQAQHLTEATAHPVANDSVSHAAGGDEAETGGGPVPINAHNHKAAMERAAPFFDAGVFTRLGEAGGLGKPEAELRAWLRGIESFGFGDGTLARLVGRRLAGFGWIGIDQASV